MSNDKGLKAVLKEDFKLHGVRLDLMSRFIMVMIVVRTVSLVTLASALNPKVFLEWFIRRDRLSLKTWLLTHQLF